MYQYHSYFTQNPWNTLWIYIIRSLWYSLCKELRHVTLDLRSQFVWSAFDSKAQSGFEERKFVLFDAGSNQRDMKTDIECAFIIRAVTCKCFYNSYNRGLWPRYIEYYRYNTILFSGIKTNIFFTGGLGQIENRSILFLKRPSLFLEG